MAPRVSVVIPTHARETRLAFALEALAGGTLAANEFEVVIVRASGAEGPLAEPPPGLRLRSLVSDELGPVPQRNAGWRAAEAPLVAFVDDDCRPAPDWLERLLAAAERERAGSEDVIVQGRTEPDPDELHLLFGLARSIEITGATGFYETCNLLYPRALLERLGGFSDAFSLPHWGEDTDLGLRAAEAGARLVYADDAVAWHAVHATPMPSAIREAGRRRRFARLVSRHPRLRRSMPASLFVNRAHAGVACAVAGVAGALVVPRHRRAVMAVGLAPYLLHNAQGFVRGGPFTPRRLARQVISLPVRFTVDAAETVATIRGAFEDRTPVV